MILAIRCPSRHTALKQRRINVEATSCDVASTLIRRCIDVILYWRYVPAGIATNIKQTKRPFKRQRQLGFLDSLTGALVVYSLTETVAQLLLTGYFNICSVWIQEDTILIIQFYYLLLKWNNCGRFKKSWFGLRFCTLQLLSLQINMLILRPFKCGF